MTLRIPRPRFTLRLALVLTAVGAVLAWQAGIVWQRKAALKKHSYYLPARGLGHDHYDDRPLVTLRELLGDRPIAWIRLSSTVPDEEWKRVEQLFPEAKIEFRSDGK